MSAAVSLPERTPVNDAPTPRRGLSILRASEGRVWLAGPRAVVEAIAATSGLEARECGDELARVIDHTEEAVLLDAAARAGHPSVPWSCTLCEASRRGVCHVHRRMVAP